MFLTHHLNADAEQIRDWELHDLFLIGGLDGVMHATDDEGSVGVHFVSVDATGLLSSRDLPEFRDSGDLRKRISHHVGRCHHSDKYDHTRLTCVRRDPDNLRCPGLSSVGCSLAIGS